MNNLYHLYLTTLDAVDGTIAYGYVITGNNPREKIVYGGKTHAPFELEVALQQALSELPDDGNAVKLHLTSMSQVKATNTLLENIIPLLGRTVTAVQTRRNVEAMVLSAQTAQRILEQNDDDDDTPPTAPAATDTPPWEDAPPAPVQQEPAKRVLLRGYGQATREMVQYVAKVIARAAETGHIVMVEDTVGGVAGAAIYHSKRANVPLIVVGEQPIPRNRAASGERVKYAQVKSLDLMLQRADIGMLLVSGKAAKPAQLDAAVIQQHGGQPHVVAFA